MVNKFRKGPTQRWFCTCPAPKRYTSDRMVDLARRSLDVRVFNEQEWNGGVRTFDAQSTDSDNVYQVGYNPKGPDDGTVCKHIAACAAYVSGQWLRDLAAGIEEERKELIAIWKEMRRLGKEKEKFIQKLQTEIEKYQEVP